jgi:hypothetical protein
MPPDQHRNATRTVQEYHRNVTTQLQHQLLKWMNKKGESEVSQTKHGTYFGSTCCAIKC